MNAQKAIEFVRENGDVLERAKLAKLLGEDYNTQVVIAGFESLQNPDGGFPFMDRKGFPSCLSNTSMALKSLLDLDLGDSEPAKKTIEFFLERQAEDGSWKENPQITPLDPPFWDQPEDPRTTIWLTADICDNLLRSRKVGPGRLSATGDFLRDNQSPNGRMRGFINATWLAVAAFGKKGLDREGPLRDALRFLEGVDISAWDASGITWCLECLVRGGVGPDSVTWSNLVERLVQLQCEDGSWESADGEHFRVSTTVNALAMLKIDRAFSNQVV